MPRPESCRCCGTPAELRTGICLSCETRYGRKLAPVLARCLSDANYASAWMAHLAPDARQELARLVAARCLRARATARRPSPMAQRASAH